MTDIYMLFDNGESCRVGCDIWPPGSEKGIQGYVNGSPSKDFQIAADKAAYAACRAMKSFGVLPSNLQAAISLTGSENISQGPARPDSAGQSGGLAFAIATAIALKKKTDPNHVFSFPKIAATGIIEANGNVLTVGGLETKLSAAAQTLKNNAWIFYPSQSRFVISQELEQVLKTKKIQALEVDNLSQVLDLLFSDQPEVPVKTPAAKAPAPSNAKTLAWIMAALLLIASIAAGSYLVLKKTPPEAPKVDQLPQTATAPANVPESKPLPKPQPESLPPVSPKGTPTQTQKNDSGFD